MIPSGSSSNASRGRGGGGSRSHSHSRHGGGRRGSKDGGDDMRNRPLTTVPTFFNVAFDAQKMGTRVLCADFICGGKGIYFCLGFSHFGRKLIAMLNKARASESNLICYKKQ